MDAVVGIETVKLTEKLKIDTEHFGTRIKRPARNARLTAGWVHVPDQFQSRSNRFPGNARSGEQCQLGKSFTYCLAKQDIRPRHRDDSTENRQGILRSVFLMQNANEFATPGREAILERNLQLHRVAGVANQFAKYAVGVCRLGHFILPGVPTLATTQSRAPRCAGCGTHLADIARA